MSISGNNKIRVVYFGIYNKSDILTGPEKVCKRVFEEYSKIYKSLFIQYFQDGKKYGVIKKLFGYEKTTEINGNEVLRLGLFRMLYLMAKINPQVIHILCYSRYTIFIYLIKIFRKPKIYYNLNGIIRHENKYYGSEDLITVFKDIMVENVIIYFSDRIFYLSEFSKKIVYLYYSPDSGKFSKTINGIDTCFLESGLNHNSLKEINSIVFIGNIKKEEKGFGLLFESLSKCNLNWKLYVIDSINNHQLISSDYSDKIIMVDKMPPIKMAEFLKNKKVIVSPGKYDTFNISVVEAVSCGMYPILTKQTGVSEIIRDFVSASITDYGDSKTLIKCISDVLNDKLDFELFGDLRLFSWKKVLMNYYMPYYEQ